MNSPVSTDATDLQRVLFWEGHVRTATHDLNNILGTIQLLLDLSVQSSGNNTALISDLEQIRLSIAQASGVVKNLRNHLPDQVSA